MIDSSVSAARLERLSAAGMGVAMLVAAVVLLALSAGFFFYNDEFGWLAGSDDYTAATLLQPHNGHLIALPRALYETVANVFGLDYLPFRVAGVLGVLLCAGSFFLLARRRVGGPAALAPAIVLLLFGTAWNVVLSPIGIPFSYSIGLGLAALVALERGGRKGDVAACLLLLASVASHSFGVIIGLGIVVYLLQRPRPLARIWVVAIPLGLYAAWWLWALRFDQGIVEASNIAGLPVFAAESLGATMAALTGLNVSLSGSGPPSMPPQSDWAIGWPLAVLAVVALALRMRRGGLGPWFWAYLVMLIGFWVAIGMAESLERQPTTSRYLFFGAIMVLLVGAEAARGRRPSGRVLAVLSVIAAVAVAGNLIHMRDARRFQLSHAEDARAQLGVVEFLGNRAQPGVRLRAVEPGGARYVAIAIGRYLDMVERWGSAGASPQEVARQPAPVREGADAALVRGLGLGALPREHVPGGRPSRSGACRAGGAAPVPPGMYELRGPDAGGEAGQVLVGRFADAVVPVGAVPPGRAATLSLPADELPLPWELTVPPSVRVCPLEGPVTP